MLDLEHVDGYHPVQHGLLVRITILLHSFFIEGR